MRQHRPGLCPRRRHLARPRARHLARPRARHVARLAAAGIVLAGALGWASSRPAAAVADGDWLGVVNTYRAMSGLDPVSANDAWSSEATAHSCYMLQNGIAHDEVPGRPGYTPGGDVAGNSGNVAVSSAVDATPRNHIDLWMTGPFHAIGILRPNLATAGFGLCANATTAPYRSAATLDVVRGIDPSRPRPANPVVFPGNGATVPLSRFITETPNPLTMCGWSGSAGLPLIALMPHPVNTATATLTGPHGPIQTCVLHRGNVSDGTAQAILGGDNAIVVMPRDVLDDGTYSVSVTSDGGDVAWSFDVRQGAALHAAPVPLTPTAPAAPPAELVPVAPFRWVDSREGLRTVRLQGGQVTRVDVAGRDVAAVSANFVAVAPEANGYLTAYNCTDRVPTVSTIGYTAGQVVANQAIVPLRDGALCLYSLVSTDVVMDVNGYYRTGGGASGFTPTDPVRLYDSRTAGGPLAPGEERRLVVAGPDGTAPAGAAAVALNVTVTQPGAAGYLQVYPCGSPTADTMSTVNYGPGESRPNAVVTPVDASGAICLRSLAGTDVAVDYTGYFAAGTGLELVALDPIRIFDSSSTQPELNAATGGSRIGAGQEVRLDVAGARGIPANAKAVSANITVIGADTGTYVTAFPCAGRPEVSNVNLVPWQTVAANGAMVKLSPEGDLCLYALADVHVIVDVNGVWR